jgi:hypothetical protein
MTCGRMQSSYSRWSGVLKSTSAMTKMTVEPVYRRSCANSSALPVELVWKWADVPCYGSGSPASGALPPETARKQPGEPPKIDLQGVDGVEEARARTPPNPPFDPTPTTLRRSRGRATLSEVLIATSHAFSALLQGQHGQRCGGAPSSGTTRRLTGRARASA